LCACCDVRKGEEWLNEVEMMAEVSYQSGTETKHESAEEEEAFTNYDLVWLEVNYVVPYLNWCYMYKLSASGCKCA
jgi:hypothetical protein